MNNPKAQMLLDLELIDEDSLKIDDADDAIIGAIDQRIVYSYHMVVECIYISFMQDPKIKEHFEDDSDDDHVLLMAQEWVDCNYIDQCELVHLTNKKTPIIVYTI